MSSRLFQAVVGLGIALGTASAACLGAIEPQSDVASDVAPPGQPRTGPPSGGPGAPEGDDAGAGGPATDASTPALKDAAILDAFCDAAWPTTKGNPGGPTCGPVTACSEAGPAPICFRAVAGSAGTCDPQRSGEVAWCVAGEWRCSGDGVVPQEQCTCWAGTPCVGGAGPASSGR